MIQIAGVFINTSTHLLYVLHMHKNDQLIPFFNKESQKVEVEHTEKITQAVTWAERMQQTETEKLREQKHDTADVVTKRFQELDPGDKNPDSRMRQENEECVESEVGKLHMPQREEGVGVTKTSAEETGFTAQKSDSLVQKNIAPEAFEGGVSPQTTTSRLSTNVKNIPLVLYKKICLMLNGLKDVSFHDFRMLGKLMKIDRDCIWSSVQKQNPTHEILTLWCQGTPEPTVGKLIEILKHKDLQSLQRMDVVKILEKWIQTGDPK